MDLKNQKNDTSTIFVEEIKINEINILEEGIQPGGALCGMGCIAGGVWCGFGCPK